MYADIDLNKQASKFKEHHLAQGLPFTRERFENWLDRIREVKARKDRLHP